MSLALAAQHLQHHGRNGDTMLVHMSPKEVKGLNDLAMAHGGHLTINPHTGLPEAGFLSSILPMVAGMALNAAFPGAGMLIPAIVGAGSYMMNPKQGIMGGLMAGLGAYGGMGIGSSIASAGVSQMAGETIAADAAKQSALEGIPAQDASFYAKGATPTQIAAAKSAVAPGIAGQMDLMGKGITNISADPTSFLKDNWKAIGSAAAGPLMEAMKPDAPEAQKKDSNMGQQYAYTRQTAYAPSQTTDGQPAQPTNQSTLPAPDLGTYSGGSGREQSYYKPGPIFTPVTNAQAYKMYGYEPLKAAEGGVMHYDDGGAVRTLPIDVGGYSGYGGIAGQQAAGPLKEATENQGLQISPELQAFIQLQNQPQPTPQKINVAEDYNNYVKGITAAPPTPTAGTGIGHAVDPNSFGYSYNPTTQAYTKINAPAVVADTGGAADPGPGYDPGGYSYGGQGEANGGLMAAGGMSHLGDYSDGGRLLKGPGDGVSDSIPAVIGQKQPARLADGEFVVPARIVSEIGNGSTEAGARKLYAMMDRVQSARGKTVGKGRVAKNTRAEQYLPA